MSERGIPEPWLGKRELARHYACGVRSIERRMVEGMPYALIFGRIKFQVSSTDAWLEDNGYFERKAESSPTLDGQRNGAAALARPAPGHEE